MSPSTTKTLISSFYHIPGMAYCTCKPGYVGGSELGRTIFKGCDMIAASSPGFYSPNGIALVECGNHTSSAVGAKEFADCTCLEEYERVENGPECVTVCVAAPGQWCGESPNTDKKLQGKDDDPILQAFDCEQGFFCPGGRGEGKYPCQSRASSYCPAKNAVAFGEACPAGFACAGGQVLSACIPPKSFKICEGTRTAHLENPNRQTKLLA